MRQECSPYGPHTRCDFCLAKVSKRMSRRRTVTHLRFHWHCSAFLLSFLPPPPLLLLRRRRRLPLNVRQVIYTRGFTARKILRKAVTRTETGATRPSRPEKRRPLPRTKNHFLHEGIFERHRREKRDSPRPPELNASFTSSHLHLGRLNF